MSTGAAIGVTAAVVAVVGTGVFLFYKGNKAAEAQRLADQAAAGRAASNAKSPYDLGRALADLGGRALAEGAKYLFGGPAAVITSQDNRESWSV